MNESYYKICILVFIGLIVGGFLFIKKEELRELFNSPSEIAESLTLEEGISQVSFQQVQRIGTKTVEGTSVALFTAFILNPTTGDRQAVWLFLPELEQDVPLVVMVQGGSGNSEEFVKSGSGRDAPAELIASNALAVIAYDALGVGRSQGDQDYQGFADQDGLAAIVSAGKALDGVDEQTVGLASFSYGVTSAVGVLARYPELGISFYSDWEGPSSRFYTTVGCGASGRYKELTSPAIRDCQDVDYWFEREAEALMKGVSGLFYYWRIQEENDHVQSTYGHTVEMLTAAQFAGIPWFRVNNGEVNRVYDEGDVPTVPNANHYVEYVIPHILEMIRLLQEEDA